MRHLRATRALNFESLAISHAEKCYGVLCAPAAILQRLINRRTLPLLALAHLHSCTFSPSAQTRFSRNRAEVAFQRDYGKSAGLALSAGRDERPCQLWFRPDSAEQLYRLNERLPLFFRSEENDWMSVLRERKCLSLFGLFLCLKVTLPWFQ